MEDQGKIDGGATVFTTSDGFYCSYAGIAESSIFKIRLEGSSIVDGKFRREIWEYQYTHVGPEKFADENGVIHVLPYTYVAGGVELGLYGLYGATTASHLHLTNKVFIYNPASHPCAVGSMVPKNECSVIDSTDDCPQDPYRRVDY